MERDYKNFKRTENGTVGTESGIKKESGTADRKSDSGNRNSENSRTDSRGTADRKSDSGNSGRGKTEGIKSEKILSLPNVNVPTPEEPKTTKKKGGRKKKESESTFTAEQFTSLIVGVSSIVASREGCEHWLISEKEAKQISEPLSKIIAKNENLKALSEHADGIALVTACLMIIAPRLIITMQMNKAKKKIKGVTENAGKSNTGNTDVNRNKVKTANVTNDKTVFDSISPII